MIQHHRQYFLDEPRRRGVFPRRDFAVLLPVRQQHGRGFRSSVKEFTGPTRLAAEELMVAWIEQAGAVEADLNPPR